MPTSWSANTSADILGRFRIVIAGDPQPVAAALQRRQRRAVEHRDKTARPVAIVETVAERDHQRGA